MKPELFAQLEFLRAHIESVVERSAAIMITSAKERDGKSLTASGLAERLADTGRQVVLVQFHRFGLEAPAQHALDRIRSFPIVLFPVDDDDASPLATPVLRAKIEELRTRYDYTIVDGAPLLQSRVATLLANMVDAILVTVRLGRTSDGDDAALVEALQRTDASVLGVVAVSAKDMTEFAERLVSRHPGDGVAQFAKNGAPLSTRERTVLPSFEGSRI